jgi:DNA-binding transcriptional ArsR family regulator
MARAPRRTGLSGPTLREAAELLRLLGHPVRLRLLECLAEGETVVGDLAEAVGRPAHDVSQHLHRLRAKGVVARRRQGRSVRYRLRDRHVLGILAWIHQRRYERGGIQDGEAI